MYKKLILGAALAMSIGSVEAFKINPMHMELYTKKPQGFFTITNNTDGEEVVLAYAANRLIDEWGEEKAERCEDFIIYPSHLVLKPGEQRLVRVIWKEKEKILEEKAYRLIFEQQMTTVPKSEQELAEGVTSTSIGIGLKFVCSLYVAPNEKLKGDVQVEKFSIVEEDGKNHLIVTLQNRGAKHKYISPKTLEVNIKGAEKEGRWYAVPDNLLTTAIQGNLNLLPGHKRLIKIPIDAEMPRDIVAVSISD